MTINLISIKYISAFVVGVILVFGTGCDEKLPTVRRQLNQGSGPIGPIGPIGKQEPPKTYYDFKKCGQLGDSESCKVNLACTYLLNRFDAKIGKCVATYTTGYKACGMIQSKDECELVGFASEECTYLNNVCELARIVRDREDQNRNRVAQDNNAWDVGGNVGIGGGGEENAGNLEEAQNRNRIGQDNNALDVGGNLGIGGGIPVNPINVGIGGGIPVNPINVGIRFINDFAADGRHRVEVELARNRIVNAGEFIHDARPHHLKERVAARLANNVVLDGFFALNPTYEQVWDLLRQNGGFATQALRDLSLMLKARAAKMPISGAQYTQIMGQVFADAFNNDDYLDANAFQILDSVEKFVGIREGEAPNFNKTFKDIENVKQFVQTVRMPAAVPNQTILNIVARINAHVAAKKIQHKAQIIPRIRALVLAKLNQVNPPLDERVRYFHLRDPGTWGINNILVQQNFECSICMSDIDGIDTHDHLTYKGYDCPFQQGAHTYVCDECINQMISADQDLIMCPVAGHRHELPVTQEMVAEALENDPERIFKRELRTLKAYATALRMDYVSCGQPECDNIVFRSEADVDNHHVTCSNCETKFCHKCKKDTGRMRSHVGLVCVEQARDDHVGPEVGDIRPCPYCGAPIERTEGCNAMICACGGRFNWVNGKYRLGANFEERHWLGVEGNRRNDVPPLRLYRVRGDDDYAPGKETAYPGAGRPMSREESALQN